jgi:site-specific recombinase
MNMSIIGKLIGLRADTVITAVAAGSFTIAIMVAFMVKVGYELYQQSPYLLILFIIITIQAILIIYMIYRWIMVKLWEKETGLVSEDDPA